MTTRTTILVAGTAALLLLAACSSVDPIEPGVPYVAETTITSAPEPIGSSDTLRVEIAAYLGPNLCYQLDHLATARTYQRLDITVYGVYHNFGACLQAVSTYHDELVISPPFQGTFTIAAHQPDGSTAEHTVTVVND